MNNVVIIGASHAAAEAIATLRKQGWEDQITLIGDEAMLPYQRPPLSKGYYNNEIDNERLLIKNEQFYTDCHVTLMLGHRVASINPADSTLQLDNGDNVVFSHLILATGTRARHLPIPGADLPQINTLRTKHDVDRIKAQLQPGSSLLIVGAGYIGLEVAASAIKQGIKVTVLEAMDRVLARVTGKAVSEFYQRVHARAGVDIRLNAKLVEFGGDDHAAYAVMEDGEHIPFDCAIVGIGVVPNVELAEQAGLSCDNGVLVDEFTRTSQTNIYAVGDCSNHPSFIYDRHIRLESVPNAVGQAKTAAMAICGNETPYDLVPWFWSDQYDIKLQTVGLCADHDQVVVRGDPAEDKFAAFYLQAGRLIAVDAINSPAEFTISKRLVTAKATPDPVQLADVDVAMRTFL